MVGICIGKSFKTDKAQEFIDFVAFHLEYATRDEPCLNVPADGKPWEKVGVLENQTALGAGGGTGVASLFPCG